MTEEDDMFKANNYRAATQWNYNQRKRAQGNGRGKYPSQQRNWNNSFVGNQAIETTAGETNEVAEEGKNTPRGNHKPAYFLQGRIGNEDLFMLYDTGSLTSLLDEIALYWNPLNAQCNLPQKKTIEIIGQTKIQFKLYNRIGNWQEFTYKFMIARNLSEPAILGMDFFSYASCYDNLNNDRVHLYQNRMRTAYHLVGETTQSKTMEIALKETITISARTIMRMQYTSNDKIADGEQVIFKPTRNMDVLIAAGVNITHD